MADGVAVSEFTTPARRYSVYCMTVPAGSMLFPLCSGATATISRSRTTVLAGSKMSTSRVPLVTSPTAWP